MPISHKQRIRVGQLDEDKKQQAAHRTGPEVQPVDTHDTPKYILGNRALMRMIEQGTIQPQRDLSGAIGNHATAVLAEQGMIQLGRKNRRRGKQGSSQTTTAPTLSQEEIKKRIMAGQKRRQEEKAAQKTWGAWFASWIPGGAYEGVKEGAEEDEGGVDVYEDEGDAWTNEDPNAEPEPEEKKDFVNPFAFEELEIDLGEAKMDERQTALGTAKASGSSSMTMAGESTYGGKGSLEGAFGKAEGSGKVKLSADKIKGEGKLGFLLGASSETKTGKLGWGIHNNILEGEGKMENKVGLEAEAAAKTLYNSKSGDFLSEGKLGALLGAKTEGTIKVKLKAGNKDLGSTEGKLGLAVGVGGEIKGKLEFKGGKLTFEQEGKLVAGIGFSYGYKLTVDTKALGSVVSGWMPTLKNWLWELWSLPDYIDEDDILII